LIKSWNEKSLLTVIEYERLRHLYSSLLLGRRLLDLGSVRWLEEGDWVSVETICSS
jgi:hypothetical protein